MGPRERDSWLLQDVRLCYYGMWSVFLLSVLWLLQWDVFFLLWDVWCFLSDLCWYLWDVVLIMGCMCRADGAASVRLSEIYAQLEEMEADKAPAKY